MIKGEDSMKTIKIIAREKIINPRTGNVHSDEGLRALDGYFEDIKEVEDKYNGTSLILQYEELYPEIKGWDFQIIELS